MTIQEQLIPEINSERLRDWRRHLHQFPETGFDVEDTAEYIAAKLESFGIEAVRGIGQTGVVGILKKGITPTHAIGLRADMDALKIQELNEFEHRSRLDGRMHACGHDGHIVMLLGAAKMLSTQEFNGIVYFIFQPNEEHGLGAQAMVDDGLFEKFPMQSIYGMHNMPGMPLGQLAMKSGAIMAGEDSFEIRIQGRGGHASQPHHHIDPLVISAEIIQALQTIVSRNIDPSNRAVVSVTEIETDGTVNVIPSTVMLKGDCRSFEETISNTIEKSMRRLVTGICSAHGAEVEFSYKRLFHATTNAQAETEHAYQAALATVGTKRVEYPTQALTISEDFANMLRVKDGCYIFIGNGEDSVGGCMLHNPHYDFNDAILPIGARYWVNLVLQQLPKTAQSGFQIMIPKYNNHYSNPRQDNLAYTEADKLFSNDECRSAQEKISRWPGYKATPLIELSDFAQETGVNKIFYKDESSRLGLGSFKALGGSYAIQELAEKFENTDNGQLIVSTATDGNHGRSVAWGALLLGIECHIFLHQHVTQGRQDSMTNLGAIIHRVSGNYDDSVAACIEMSGQHQWQIVSDTSWGDYQEIPRQIMVGYTVMAEEIIQQLGTEKPSHIFIPAGCGGLAGAMIAYFWQYWKQGLPSIVIIESEKSDCVYQSLTNKKISLVDIVDETVMAGLSCGEVSQLAWPLLERGVKHVITIGDENVVPMMRRLAESNENNQFNRPSIEAGECSTAGLITLKAICADPALSNEMGINESSTILMFGTEGATDPEFYQSIFC